MTGTATTTKTDAAPGAIKALDTSSVHRISSGQVVIDLQTAVKELLENSLDAGATSVEVRFKEYGLDVIEVVDNGSGIAPGDYDAIALKHHTSKLSSFDDLTALHTFGFRGEALSSLCALAEHVTVTTATAADAPMGTVVELDRAGRVASRQGRVARQRGTTVAITGLFKPLPVRRKELERNAKREFGKALALLSAYALVPCAQENKGVRLSVTHHPAGGRKTVQLRTDGTPLMRASVSALWGPKALEHLVELDLRFGVETEKAVLRRRGLLDGDGHMNEVRVRGLVSKFAVGCGRTGTDRQFFFINGRPCNPSKVQKAFNEVYRTFNANQSPFIVADFILPTDSCDVNVSPDKRTILLHSESNLVQGLKAALEERFAPSRATYDLNPTLPSQSMRKHGAQVQTPTETGTSKTKKKVDLPLFLEEDAEDARDTEDGPDAGTGRETLPSMVVDENGDEGFGEPSLLLGRQSMAQVVDVAATEPGDESLGNDTPSSSRSERRPSPSPSSLVPTQTARTAFIKAGTFRQLSVPQVSALPDEDETDTAANVDEITDDTNDVSLTATQMQTGITESDSPSASQAVVLKETGGASGRMDEGDKAHSLRPDVSPPTQALGGKRAHVRSAQDGEGKSVQMVLSTTGAAWDLRRVDEHDNARPRKRARVGEVAGPKEGKDAREDLRAALKGFARTGSHIMDVDMGEAEEDESQKDELDEVEDHIPQLEDTEINMSRSSLKVDTDAGEVLDADLEGEDRETVSKVLEQAPIIDLTEEPGSARTGGSSADAATDATTPAVSSVSGASRVSRPEVVRAPNTEDTSFHFELSRIVASWQSLRKSRSESASLPGQRYPSASVKEDAGVANTDDDSKATAALSRVINKADFASMEIVGQFNLGFIIARRRKQSSSVVEEDAPVMDDLFIVDQHAADEKYNFETLQQTTRIESQKLFRPQPLELTAADELLATENIDVLRQNGFEIDLDGDVAPGEGHRLRLVAQPTSKSTVFDMKDLEELLHLMQDRPTGQMVRCSKARAMFAMHDIGRTAYGDNGSALELSTRTANDAPSI
ncbi:hypothetical protein AcV5_010002 [Taiwanofungus camphoratus]|nr:hypothetical protein AcV5_010002 [Antrodia cinnamomea]